MHLRLRPACFALLLAVGPLLLAFPRSEPQQKSPLQLIAESTDIAWLERIAASPWYGATLGPTGGLGGNVKDLRTAAYARLGQIGTLQSRDAMGRVETAVGRFAAQRDYFWPNLWTHPAWHFLDSPLRSLAQTQASNGITYALVISEHLGDLDLFLTSTKTPDSPGAAWSRPKLVPWRIYRGIREPSLATKSSEELVFRFVQEEPPPRALMEGTTDRGPAAPHLGAQEWSLSISAIEKDSDKDGLTDLEEARLGLDPRDADTDADGIPDGRDISPNYAFAPEEHKIEDVNILQKAFFAAFSLSSSRYLLIAGPETQRVQMWAYPGNVIYGRDWKTWQSEHQYGAVFVTWKITLKTESEATVQISDYEGPLSAGTQEILLRRIGNEWIVVGRKLVSVS